MRPSAAVIAPFFTRHPQPMWVYDPRTLEFLTANDAAQAHYGYTLEQFRSMKVTDVEQDMDRLFGILDKLPESSRMETHNWRHRRADGSIIHVDIVSQAITYNGQDARLITLTDITAALRAQERLAHSEAELAAAQQVAHMGSFFHDLVTDERRWSPQLYEIYGVSPEQPLPQGGIWIFDHPADAQMIRAQIDSARQAKQPYSLDHRIVRADGVVRHVFEQGRWTYSEAGEPVSNIGTILDITDRKETEAALAQLAYHDSLTGLPNRTRLIEEVQTLIDRSRQGELLAFFFLDLDRFKIINDTLGHRYGDEVLVEIGHRLRATVRSDAVVARPGGDEFIIVLPNVSDKLEVSRHADAVLDAFAKPFSIAGNDHVLGASIGVSLFPLDGREVDTLLQTADTAMYAAKQRGGNNFHFYTASLQHATARRFRLESALRRALDHNEFELYYQPILSVRTGQIVGAEALIRWNDPAGGVVMPGEFIPFAEEAGLITPIGEWVLKEACVQAKLWSASGRPIKIWINVSAPQLHHPTLAGAIRERLAQTGLDAKLIGLELTESSFINATRETLSTLHELRGMGVNLALDDFGVAYSSLDYLRRLPIDTIKIDRTFLREISNDRFNQSIVRAITGLAHDLDLRVSAEGVETTDQFAFLTDLGCDDWQGFYYGEAEPAMRFAHMMRDVRFAV